MAFEDALRLGMQDQRDPERLGDAGGGDVVMGRADPAGREDVIEVRAAPR